MALILRIPPRRRLLRKMIRCALGTDGVSLRCLLQGVRGVGVVSLEDPFHLQRFVAAQRDIYAQVEAELRAGRKESHWMWFIFPQIEGLGQSPMAQKYTIKALAEAVAYLNHPVLGCRLHTCTRLVAELDGQTAEDIFGYPDYLKFQASMTLFARATDNNGGFMEALRKYFHSEFDRRTIERLPSPAKSS